MDRFTTAFGDELLKLARHAKPEHGESDVDAVAAEALGPIGSMVKGYKHSGVKGALKGGAGFTIGGGLGAAGGLVASRVLKKLTGGHDVGVGPLRASTVFPAIGGLLGGLKGAKMSGVS